ncbi:TIGR03960 family B12-binding radical SAM protein [candidate division KSB1 bacterium]|nr:MAG: TIGR03960 family B12-binding radical SAM protein [candidate division KSB1 bacterium]
MALVFPDVYEVGMSYMGFPILYNILNQLPWVYAERAFAPGIDMRALMRAKKAPLFSLETFSALSDFDVIGFTLQYELHYTTILDLIDLAGLPVEAKDREGLPIVIGGGPSAFNPEPMADFFDAIVLGDGEEVIVEIAAAIRRAKKEGLSRPQIMRDLAKISGVYVPQFYQARYRVDGRFEALEPTYRDAPRRIKSRTAELSSSNYPERPLVPMIQTAHDRISLEISRGCSRGCRFCSAGMTYRPVRQRTPQDLVEQAKHNIAATGYEDISLASLSTSDYTRLAELMRRLSAFSADKVSLSFPSIRPESFTMHLAHFARGVRKSGLTLAPEAGSQRLRDVINKATAAPELLRAVDLAFSQGWTLVKLYFMIGHPTETDEDLQALVDLIQQVSQVAFRYRGKRINVSISPFVPKPLTPFQWVRQDSAEETQRKINFLRQSICSRNVKLSWRDPDVSRIEGVLARGDRRVARIIKGAWQLGAYLEGWSEFFDATRYEAARKESDQTFDHILNGCEIDQPLPWDHIDKGVTKKYLRDDYRRALGGEKVADCRFDVCHSCGLMGQTVCQELIRRQRNGEELEMPIEFQQMPEFDVNAAPLSAKAPVERIVHARIHYRRGEQVRFLSHLDLLRLFERALRRARIRTVFSQGFNPHPKLSFGPPLATGLTSDAEYVDVPFYLDEEGTDLQKRLSPQLPLGIEIADIKYLDKKAPSLAALLNRTDFEFRIDGGTNQTELDRIHTILSQKELHVERKRKDKSQMIDIRPFIDSLEVTEWGLRVRTRMEEGRSLRTDELVSLLFPHDKTQGQKTRIHRAGLWLQRGDRLYAPMELCDAEAEHAQV